MNRPLTMLSSLALAGCLCSCAQNVANQVVPAAPGVSTPLTPVEVPAVAANPPADADPGPQAPSLVRLDVFEITLPLGAVSDSDTFWKHIEEPVVDVATADLLYSNGLRAGEGVTGDWNYFKQIFDAAGATGQHFALTAHDAQSQELFSTPDMAEQRLFFFDAHGLSGRVYDECRDLFMLSYQPAPRKPGMVRIALCPEVQATRYHYNYTARNSEESLRLLLAEHLYDLNLTVDLPTGRFLVVAPSPDARQPDSIGNHFLIENGAAQQMERVLILVSNSAENLPLPGPSTRPLLP